MTERFSTEAWRLEAFSDGVLAVARALGGDFKGKASPLLYVAAIGVAFVAPVISYALYVLVAVMWLVPDRRFEPVIAQRRR